MSADMSNEVVEKLRHFFATHPTWVEAARTVKEGANSEVFFKDIPGTWQLMRKDGVSLLLTGKAPSPDFSFLFNQHAVEALAAIGEGEVADFAICLFDLITHDDDAKRVGFRIAGPFLQILRRGYLQVLLKGGPRVLQYAARHGVTSLSEFNHLLASVSGRDVDWTSLRRDR